MQMMQPTGTPMLSGAIGIPAYIRGMASEDVDTTRALLKVWRDKYPRNLLRSAFYDARQRFLNLQISVQSNLGRKIGNTVGWPQKSVRALADKSVFEGFELPHGDEHGINEICMDNELTADVSEAIISCYKHSCSFLTVDYDPYDPSGERIMITPRSADWSAAIWDPQRRRIAAALTITGADANGTITSFNVWLPGRNYAVSSRNGLAGWQAQRQDNRLDRVAVVPFAYDKQMDRPFGRSRINRTLMNLTDMAVRTMVRMEVSAEFYSVPKLWFLGLDKDAFESGTWSSLIADINAISRDVDGEVPDLKQILQASMSPHGAMLETIAMLASAETDIPPRITRHPRLQSDIGRGARRERERAHKGRGPAEPDIRPAAHERDAHGRPTARQHSDGTDVGRCAPNMGSHTGRVRRGTRRLLLQGRRCQPSLGAIRRRVGETRVEHGRHRQPARMGSKPTRQTATRPTACANQCAKGTTTGRYRPRWRHQRTITAVRGRPWH